MRSSKVGLIAVLLSLVLIALWNAWQLQLGTDVPFNSNIWKQSKSNERLGMVHDLLKKHNNLLGLTRGSVDDLLGEPESQLDKHIREVAPEYDYVYVLGARNFFGDVDGFFLGLRFHNNVVAESKIM